MFNAVANAVEARMEPSHTDGTVAESNPQHHRAPEAPDGPREKMLALTWQGVNKVEMQQCDVPVLINDHDIIIKVTGTTGEPAEWPANAEQRLTRNIFSLRLGPAPLPRRTARDEEARYSWT